MQPSQLGAEYEQMLDSLPATETTVLSTARALEIQGEADKACALLEEAVTRHAAPNLCKSLAALHLKYGRFQRSAQVLDQLVGPQSTDVPTVLLLAEVQIKAGDHAQAARTLQRAKKLGASRLRVFKLEQQLDGSVGDTTEPRAAATGPMPPMGADTDPDTTAIDPTTKPRTPTRRPPPMPSGAQQGDNASDSAIFEDGTFSNLTSFDLPDEADDYGGGGTPAIFDTLVDTYQDDLADRSFDDLLLDLGVPVDEDAATDPDATGHVVRREDADVAAEWGLGNTANPQDATGALDLDRLRAGATAERPSPPEHTPRFHETHRYDDDADDLADDDFDDEHTEMLTVDHALPPAGEARGQQPPDEEFPAEPPTRIEAPTKQRKRRLTQQGYAVVGPKGSPRPKLSTPPEPSTPPKPSLPPASSTPANLELDDAARRPLPPRPTGPQRAIGAPAQPAATPMHQKTGASDGATNHGTSVGRLLREHAAKIVPLVAVGLLLVVGGLCFAASMSAESAIATQVTDFRKRTLPDTYAGYVAGDQALQRAIAAHSFLGASLDGLLSGVGLMGGAKDARADAIAEHAAVTAMMEYRYEHLGTRGAKAAIAQAEAAVSGDPRVDVARGYRLLAQGRAQAAIDLLNKTHATFPDLAPLDVVLTRAQLDAHNFESAARTAKALRKLTKPTPHQHFVLGLVEEHRSKKVADARYKHLLDQLSPDHISARIRRSYTLRHDHDKAAAKQAAELLGEVFGALQQKASPLQLAKAHIARGDIYVAQDQAAHAEEQYRKAIDAVPERGAVYAPLIELYLRGGRLDQALELIANAQSKGVDAPDLLLRRAELLRLTGRPQAALQALKEQKAPGARGLLDRGPGPGRPRAGRQGR